MLTRLRISGFKNLVNVDVRFGPFTCIAGANGVGKSNLFDAITFLSSLASYSLIEAALRVRDEGARTADLRSIFHRVGDKHTDEMSFEAEMIIPPIGSDDLGQEAKASTTFVRYSLALAYRSEHPSRPQGTIEVLSEELTHINVSEAPKHILFPHSSQHWRRSAITGRRTSSFISTEGSGKDRIVKLHQDKIPGRPFSRSAASLPRTVLSTASAAESPTALLTRREMQSWSLLQLEPAALRKPDEFTSSARLGSDGSHLAATLARLERTSGIIEGETEETARSRTFAQIANRLSELIDDVRRIWVDRDDKRELLTVHVSGRDGTPHAAKSLSDGTLRFLALSVLAFDPEANGVLCLEEPENGIHPERIPAILRLLEDIATDPYEEVGNDNPLRQVIINTHSPSVVAQVPDDSLVVAELKETVEKGDRFKRVCFSCLPDTWREKASEKPSIVSRGQLSAYLNPVSVDSKRSNNGSNKSQIKHKVRRVMDREDLQLLIPFSQS
ncbi:AAA family ATPase [Gloeobacter morelensis]|uniref:AAA family ATPase n=1 Tax=Gloeobacter morelensis MG652769 TaxID=2781736 RepID=A0ABY3PL33_9CYAN|nr:AAA family ATPase [Gloeobacter morelensis]UFP94356.1 AAA family ATPase [Gloeobacter morelensis MG652769]